MSGGLGIPRIDFSPLSQLGTTLAEGQREQDRRQAISGLGVAPGSPDFLPKLGQALIGLGDVNGAVAVARLQSADQDRVYQRQTDRRDFDFKTRAFDLGRQDVAADRARQERQDTRLAGVEKLANYYRDRADQRSDATLELQRQAATRRELPANYEADPNVPGGVRPVAGGPTDPATIARAKAAENSAKGGQNLNPYAPDGGVFNEAQGKSAVFADRMFDNERLVQPLEQVGTSRVEQAMEGRYVPALVGSVAHSDDFKSYKAAKDNWIAAQLRKESGAAIAQAEYDQADRQYFPQPGDGPRQLEEKRQRRRIATEGMAREGGGSYRPRYAFGERNAVVERPAASPTATYPSPDAPRMIQLGQIQDGQRFRRDGRIYRRVNGQDVPE